MSVRGIGHVNFRAPADTIERLRRFYVDVVGLREGPRPAFRSGSHGHWLYAGERDIVHLTIAADVETSPQHLRKLWFCSVVEGLTNMGSITDGTEAADVGDAGGCGLCTAS